MKYLDFFSFFYDPPTGFEDGVFRDLAPHAAGGIDVAVPPDDGARVQHTVAAYLHIIAQHGAHLLAVVGVLVFPVLLDHRVLSDFTLLVMEPAPMWDL